LQSAEEIFLLFGDEEVGMEQKSSEPYRETNPVVIADDKQTGFWKTGVDSPGGHISALAN